jgi:hypothetical protein
VSTSASIPASGADSVDLSAFDDEEVPAPAPPPPPPAPPPPPPITAAVTYLFESGDVSRQYRVAIDILRLDPLGQPEFSALPLSSRTALQLATTQRRDGGWGGGALTRPENAPDGIQGVGLIPGIRRLVELGWGIDTPPLHAARRTLFRLISEEDDPSLRFEFAGTTDRVLAARQRMLLREAAGAALAHAGLEDDPRLRGLARRVLDRIVAYLKSPLAVDPWIAGGSRAELRPEAMPPSVYALQLLAYMPKFRSEHHQAIARLVTWLTRPVAHAKWTQRVGATLDAQPHLVLGDPLAAPFAPDLPSTLGWLELFARLGVLRRHEPWGAAFDRLLAQRDEAAIWHAPAGMVLPTTSTDPAWWHAFTLGAPTAPVDWSLEVTFRLALISRLSGRALAYR